MVGLFPNGRSLAFDLPLDAGEFITVVLFMLTIDSLGVHSCTSLFEFGKCPMHLPAVIACHSIQHVFSKYRDLGYLLSKTFVLCINPLVLFSIGIIFHTKGNPHFIKTPLYSTKQGICNNHLILFCKITPLKCYNEGTTFFIPSFFHCLL